MRLHSSIFSLRYRKWSYLFVSLAITVEVWAAPAPLVVGPFESRPVIFQDARGNISGLFPELLEEIARQEGWSIRYKSLTWNECLEQLQTGGIDLIPAIAFTEERKAVMDFNREPVVLDWGQVVVANDSPVADFEDLQDLRMAAVKGDVYNLAFREMLAGIEFDIEITEVDCHQAVIDLLNSGMVEAGLVSYNFASYAAQSEEIRLIPVTTFPVKLCFAAAKLKAHDQLAAIDRAIEAMDKDRYSPLNRSRNRWMKGGEAIFLPVWLAPRTVTTALVIAAVFAAVSYGVLQWQIRKRTRQLKTAIAKSERTRLELELGREIQANILPSDFAAFRQQVGLDIFTALIPAREVGGDFYDVFPNHNGDRVGFLMGDVSGKGVPASLFMVHARDLIRSATRTFNQPAQILRAVNQELSNNNDSCTFVTTFLGLFDVANGVLSFCNAGHDYPLLLHKDRPTEVLTSGHCSALGIDANNQYQNAEIAYEQGDVLCIYTDGVVEAMDTAECPFALDGLKTALEQTRGSPAQQIVNNINRAVCSHADGMDQHDDIAMMVIRNIGDAAATESQLSIHLKNDISAIDKMWIQWQAYCQSALIDDDTMNDLRLVLEEALANIIQHGYPDDAEHIIEVCISMEHGQIAIAIEDDGAAFNPLAHTTQPERAVLGNGGYGIHIYRQLIDEAAYERRDERNHLLLIRKLDHTAEKPGTA